LNASLKRENLHRQRTPENGQHGNAVYKDHKRFGHAVMPHMNSAMPEAGGDIGRRRPYHHPTRPDRERNRRACVKQDWGFELVWMLCQA